MVDKKIQNWSLDCARELYNIPVWGETYFDINESGHMVANIPSLASIDLIEVSRKLNEQGLSQPVLLRFPQILKARLQELRNAFAYANDTSQSDIKHVPFYPIKVNQQHTVIKTLLDNEEGRVGLEVGSKTELLVALGMLDVTNGMLICNGYKDRAYIRIALYAQKMGINVYIVCENISELSVIKHESSALGVTPKLGVRIRLTSVAKGNWQNSGGRNAKFGLVSTDLLKLMNTLTSWKCKEWLCMVHYHMGSQISDLNEYAEGLNEAMRIYEEFHLHEFSPGIIDIGGGLGVDYTSLRDTSFFSMSYSMRDYACAVIKTIESFCKNKNLLKPVVFTENGRAITAHHAVLMTNVLEEDKPPEEVHHPDDFVNTEMTLETIFPWGNEFSSEETITQDLLNKSLEYLNNLFVNEGITLEKRAWVEWKIHNLQLELDHEADSTAQESSKYTDKYYCNFSVFQSMPDVWGLKQIFPIAPLARLDEPPNRKARLHDLTCDSDGQIDEYAVSGSINEYLPLHELKSGEEYLLGFFLVGAYQEVLGDIHNLFGDTHAVNVVVDENGRLQFTEIEIGDCVDELLSSLHLDGQQILAQCLDRLKMSRVSENDQDEIIKEINDALFGYTYLHSTGRPAHRIKR